jgi:hypothetical protein
MKRIICFTYFISLGSMLCGIEIYLAPPVSVSDDYLLELSEQEKRFGDFFYHAVLKADEEHLLTIRRLETITEARVRSRLDASEICEEYDIDYLVYGFYKKSYEFGETEIRIYDRELKKVRKVFYGKAETPDREEMKTAVAERLVNYMYTIMGINKSEKHTLPTRTFGGIEAAGGIGYWTPTGSWFGIMTGIGKVEVNLLIQPPDILYYTIDWMLLLRYGYGMEYMFAVNKPDIEEVYLHRIQTGVPVEICILFLKQHMGYVGAVIFYRHDFVYQVRLFGSPTWSNSGTFGTSLIGGYEYWCGEEKRYAYGAELKASFDFYRHPSFEVGIGFHFRYRWDLPGSIREDETEVKSAIEGVGENDR